MDLGSKRPNNKKFKGVSIITKLLEKYDSLDQKCQNFCNMDNCKDCLINTIIQRNLDKIGGDNYQIPKNKSGDNKVRMVDIRVNNIRNIRRTMGRRTMGNILDFNTEKDKRTKVYFASLTSKVTTYHLKADCFAIAGAINIFSSSLKDLKEGGCRPCKFCGRGKDG